MSDRLVSFLIPAEFVATQALPTPSELAAGFRDGWIDEEGVVGVALAEMVAGMPLDEVMERLAVLLSDERDLVPDLVSELPSGGESPADRRFWLFEALAWVFEHRADFNDPVGVVEMLYADFDYPAEIEGLVRYMPAPTGEPAGVEAIERRWADFLDRARRDYATRAAASMV